MIVNRGINLALGVLQSEICCNRVAIEHLHGVKRKLAEIGATQLDRLRQDIVRDSDDVAPAAGCLKDV